MKNMLEHDEQLRNRGFKRIEDYKGFKVKILHECDKGHQFSANTKHLTKIGKCPECVKEERKNKRRNTNIACKQCGKISNHVYCSKECKHLFYTNKYRQKVLDKKRKNMSQEELGQMVECKICGFRSNSLMVHIYKKHNMSIEEYKNAYGAEVNSPKYKKQQSDRCKGDKNPIHKISNKQETSPFSKQFYLKKGFTEEEAEQKVKDIVSSVKEKRRINNSNTSSIEYWLKKCDGDEAKARKALKERQSTFTLEKCIKKFGEEEGKKRWQERQDKWIGTLDQKTDEEKAEINKKKLLGALSVMGKGYSKISQVLFVSIYENIKNKYSDIYFATKNNDGTIMDDGINKEYMLNVGINYRLIDFYIPSIKKMIEYNGEYWHGEAKGNQERDRIREEEIIKTIPDIKILHISEKDYKNDPDKVLQQCLEFLSND